MLQQRQHPTLAQTKTAQLAVRPRHQILVPMQTVVLADLILVIAKLVQMIISGCVCSSL